MRGKRTLALESTNQTIKTDFVSPIPFCGCWCSCWNLAMEQCTPISVVVPFSKQLRMGNLGWWLFHSFHTLSTIDPPGNSRPLLHSRTWGYGPSLALISFSMTDYCMWNMCGGLATLLHNLCGKVWSLTAFLHLLHPTANPHVLWQMLKEMDCINITSFCSLAIWLL